MCMQYVLVTIGPKIDVLEKGIPFHTERRFLVCPCAPSQIGKSL